MDKRVHELIEQNQVFKKYPVVDENTSRETLPKKVDTSTLAGLWDVLKNAVGQDLSKITMPVTFNEPLSMVQKHTEFIEYHEILRQANRDSCPIKRLGLVLSAFFMLCSNTIGRMKKFFNSLLGETYEYVEGDIKLIAEQVSHHPPISAFYCESNDFIVKSTLYLKSAFSISSFKVYDLGSTEVKLLNTGEVFDIFPSKVSVHNYMIGSPYLMFYGKMKVINKITEMTALITFKKKGFMGGKNYNVKGNIVDSKENELAILSGSWDKELILEYIDKKSDKHTLVRKHEGPNPENQFKFSKFAVNLNNLDKKTITLLPPTDSRLRPDIRALEQNDIRLASTEKDRLEVNQRKRRKENGEKIHIPQWFILRMNNDKPQIDYKGGYFECRSKGKFPEMIEIFK